MLCPYICGITPPEKTMEARWEGPGRPAPREQGVGCWMPSGSMAPASDHQELGGDETRRPKGREDPCAAGADFTWRP